MELNKLPSTTDQITLEGVKTISSIYDLPKDSKKAVIATSSSIPKPELQTAQEILGPFFAPTQSLSHLFLQL